jgi:dTDP-4-amino-4,6-dideoxygalactose transaminase
MISNTLGCGSVRLCTNGTASLRAAVLATNPKVGQTVLIPAISFIATANAPLTCGLIPEMVDVDNSGMMSPEALQKTLASLAEPPAAVIVAHLDGAAAKIEKIKQICTENGIYLIEDCAQSFGVKYQNKSVGTFGDFGCFSFQSNKLLSTGEGGAICANNAILFAKACRFMDHGASRTNDGWPIWDEVSSYGENDKITEVQSAILEKQLGRFEFIKNTLNLHYEQLKKIIPEEILESRPENSIPLSMWINAKKLNLKETFYSYNWKDWYLPSHPIIQNKYSPYADGFPWNLKKQYPNISFPLASELIANRICIPIPASPELFEIVLSSVQRVFA